MNNESIGYLTSVMEGQVRRLSAAVAQVSADLRGLEEQLALTILQIKRQSQTTPVETSPAPEAASAVPALDISEPSAEMLRTHARLNLINLLTYHISPEVWPMATGFLKPATWTGGEEEDYGRRLLQYQEDIAQMEIDKLLKWPSGFYRDAETKRPQLFIKTAKVWMLFVNPAVELLSNPAQPAPPSIHGFFVSEAGEGIARIELNDMDLEQLQLLTDEMKQALDLLTK